MTEEEIAETREHFKKKLEELGISPKDMELALNYIVSDTVDAESRFVAYWADYVNITTPSSLDNLLLQYQKLLHLNTPVPTEKTIKGHEVLSDPEMILKFKELCRAPDGYVWDTMVAFNLPRKVELLLRWAESDETIRLGMKATLAENNMDVKAHKADFPLKLDGEYHEVTFLAGPDFNNYTIAFWVGAEEADGIVLFQKYFTEWPVFQEITCEYFDKHHGRDQAIAAGIRHMANGHTQSERNRISREKTVLKHLRGE